LGNPYHPYGVLGSNEYFTKLAHKHGKAKALTVLAHKLGRAVYYMLTREQAFDLNRFVTA
jgi:hypothetical protein